MLDRFDCYELCVQSPRHVTRLLRQLHGSDPRVLREDFCGTAAVSRRWVEDARRDGLSASAVAVDLDAEVLVRARRHVDAQDLARDVVMRCEDCASSPLRTPDDACDVIYVGNFSIGYIHARPALVEYLRRSRERLALGAGGFGGGVFVCDTYDGEHKYRLGAVMRKHPSRGHEMIHYTWQHRNADPLTAIVENAIHFRVERDGVVEAEYPDAFVYRWRLWSLPELREAMLEAGFVRVDVFAEVGDGARPIEHPSELPESGVVCVSARA